MRIDSTSLDQLFLNARSSNGFLDKPVDESLLKEIYDLAKFGPTSMNTQPARFIMLTSASAKERILPAMSPGNVDKTKSAPAVVIVASDSEFFEHLPQTFPNKPDAKELFAGNAGLAQATATRNTTLSGAYFIIAARALGLDCGPMSGFDAAKVNAEFFADGKHKVDFILNLGYADTSKIFPRNPRLSFEQACKVL